MEQHRQRALLNLEDTTEEDDPALLPAVSVPPPDEEEVAEIRRLLKELPPEETLWDCARWLCDTKEPLASSLASPTAASPPDVVRLLAAIRSSNPEHWREKIVAIWLLGRTNLPERNRPVVLHALWNLIRAEKEPAPKSDWLSTLSPLQQNILTLYVSLILMALLSIGLAISPEWPEHPKYADIQMIARWLVGPSVLVLAAPLLFLPVVA